MITTHITINLTSQVSPQLIQAVQGDTGRSICFKLADFTIPAGAAATYYIQKPSGEAIYNSATISGNEITCELTAQSLAEIGENPMQVRISADGEIVTSFDAILLVRPFRGIDAIESSTEMNIFDQAVEKAAEDFQEQAEQIVEEVIESIPSDYTELTEEVDQLNERLSDISEVETVTVDKSTGTKLSAYVSGSGNIGSNNNCKLIYVGCLPNTTYTINKVLSARFRVGYTAVTPAIGGAVSDFIENNDGTTIVITTGESAQYLVVYYYDGANDTLTESAIYDSLTISYRTDITAVDKVARDNVVRFDIVQNKTEAEKARARENIGINGSGDGLTEEVKIALLNCFANVGWKYGDGRSYYNALERALYNIEYPQIVATFTPGTHVVYTDDNLSTLKPYLIVKLFEDEQDTGQTIASESYTLSGVLQVGQNTIGVTYNNLHTAFTVTAIDFYNIQSWSYPNGGLLKKVGSSAMYNKSGKAVPSTDSNTARRSFYVNHGKIPFVNGNTGADVDGFYPIPCPDGATSITGSITPSSQYFNIRPFEYDGSTGYNAEGRETGWQLGTGTFSGLDKNKKYFFIINCKGTSSGSSYPTEPTGFSVTFGFD